MKPIQLSATLALLAISSGTAIAASGSLIEFRSRVVPVLVQVNSQGKVTEASPAMRLSPIMNRLLRANLDEMISKPATDKHGHPMSSQFVINLTLQTSPRPAGDYDAHFAYVSMVPVPAGSWYWDHMDGYQLALASQHSFNGQRRVPFRYERNQPANYRSYSPTSSPPVRNTSNNAPAPARNPGHGG